MNRDFIDMLSALSAAGADYVVVGAHALAAFGAPLDDLTKADLVAPEVLFQIGVVPCRIDILTSVSGVAFEEAWESRLTVEIEGLEVAVLGREARLRNKRAAGSPKDRADAVWLESDSEEPGS